MDNSFSFNKELLSHCKNYYSIINMDYDLDDKITENLRIIYKEYIFSITMLNIANGFHGTLCNLSKQNEESTNNVYDTYKGILDLLQKTQSSENLTFEQIENLADIKLENPSGVIYDNSHIWSKRSAFLAHTSYWSARGTFANGVVKSFVNGTKFLYDEKYQKKVLKRKNKKSEVL